MPQRPVREAGPAIRFHPAGITGAGFPTPTHEREETMSRLFLIRHAQSEANLNRLFGSRLPYPLTDEGKADADLIASQLAEITGIDRIISSPLVRAIQTAESFSRLYGVPVSQDERLSEQELGIFSGMSYDDVEGREDYEMDPMKRWDWAPPGGGESYERIARRVTSFLASLEELPPEERVLIVTHAVAFRLFRGALENTLPVYARHFPNNGEIWQVEFRKLGEVHRIESLFLGNSRTFNHNP